MIKKIFILLMLVFFNTAAKSQKLDPIKYSDYVAIDFNTGTTYKSPLIGLSVNREIVDNKFPFYINMSLTYYLHTIEKPNYLFIQSSVGYNNFKKIDVGVLLFNYQKSYSKDLNTLNYDAPFGIYLRLKNEHFKNTNVYLETSYSIITQKPAFRFSIKQNIHEFK